MSARLYEPLQRPEWAPADEIVVDAYLGVIGIGFDNHRAELLTRFLERLFGRIALRRCRGVGRADELRKVPRSFNLTSTTELSLAKVLEKRGMLEDGVSLLECDA